MAANGAAAGLLDLYLIVSVFSFVAMHYGIYLLG